MDLLRQGVPQVVLSTSVPLPVSVPILVLHGAPLSAVLLVPQLIDDSLPVQV